MCLQKYVETVNDWNILFYHIFRGNKNKNLTTEFSAEEQKWEIFYFRKFAQTLQNQERVITEFNDLIDS